MLLEPKDNLLWWVIPEVLAGMPMPFIQIERRLNHGGPLDAFNDELHDLYAAGIRAVVSLLNIPSDKPVYESAGFAFLCLPVSDGAAPTIDQVREFTNFVDAQRAMNNPVAVHCEAGLGRTGTMIAAYLIAKGEPVMSAIARVRAAESKAIETVTQIQFLQQLAHSSV
jgi:atypical dual specificity phosphatase